MRTLTHTLLLLPAFLTGLLPAQPDHHQDERGQPGFMRMHPILAAVDANRDGIITPAERDAAPKALTQALDKDRDGVISGDEMRPSFGPGGRGLGGREEARAANPADNLMALDRNGDGQLDKQEVPERMQGLFARGDENQDGKLSREELSKLAAAAPAPGAGGRGREGDRGRFGGPPRDRVAAALDLDGDGSLSAAEVAGAAKALASLDRDQDGRLTEEEVRPAFGPRGGGRRDPAEMAAHMLEEWDANRDGQLTAAELPERLRERFGEHDANQDGALSKDELAKLLAAGFGGGRR